MALPFRKNWKALTGAGSTLAEETTDVVTRDDLTNPTAPVQLAIFTVATAPAVADWTGALAYFSNGDAGSPGIAFSDGTTWLNVTTGSGIAI